MPLVTKLGFGEISVLTVADVKNVTFKIQKAHKWVIWTIKREHSK